LVSDIFSAAIFGTQYNVQSSTYTVDLLYDVFDDDSSLLDVVIRETISRHVLEEDLHCCPFEFESLYLCSGCEKRDLHKLVC